MGAKNPDLSASTNLKSLQDWLRPQGLVAIPYLGGNLAQAAQIHKAAEKIKRDLGKLLGQ